MDEGYVLVIGSAGIDVKGRPDGELQWDTPNLGRVRSSVGGVARNIAENLAHLEVPTVLLTAIGFDPQGDNVIDQCQAAGINCDHILRVPGERTGIYMAFLKANGELQVAISGFGIMNAVNSDYLQENEALFENAGLIVIDATLAHEALETLFELASLHNIPVCVDPTTPTLAGGLCQYLPQIYLIVPNASETKILCGGIDVNDRESAIEAARNLVALGTEIAVVTMGEKGLAYADGNGTGFIRSIKTNVRDSTGAGDAFSGAVIFGLLNEVPIDEAMRLGVTAASLTLQSRETVLPNLNQEMLYNYYE